MDIIHEKVTNILFIHFSFSYVSTMLSSLSTETSTHAQNFTSADDIQTTVSDVINKVNDVILRTTPSQPYYEYSTAQFEVRFEALEGGIYVPFQILKNANVSYLYC